MFGARVSRPLSVDQAFRVTAFALAVFVAAAARAGTAGLSAGDWLPADEDAETGIPCSACKFPCAKGTVNCWACGTHVPGAKPARKLLSVKLVKMSFKKADDASAEVVAALSPDLKFLQIDSWIAQNPDKFDEALNRLNDLLQEVRGSALEEAVTTRIGQLRQAKVEALKPKTPEEREAEAVTAIAEAMRKVRESKNVQKNIERLEALLKKVEGTKFEDLVRSKLSSEVLKQR